MPHIRAHAPDVVATAKAQRWNPVELLRVLLGHEVTGRDRSALATRRAAAAFPTGKTFEAWNQAASSIRVSLLEPVAVVVIMLNIVAVLGWTVGLSASLARGAGRAAQPR